MRTFDNLTRHDWYDAHPPLFPKKRMRYPFACGLLVGFFAGFASCAVLKSFVPAQTHKTAYEALHAPERN